jgi:exonuclease III
LNNTVEPRRGASGASPTSAGNAPETTPLEPGDQNERPTRERVDERLQTLANRHPDGITIPHARAVTEVAGGSNPNESHLTDTSSSQSRQAPDNSQTPIIPEGRRNNNEGYEDEAGDRPTITRGQIRRANQQRKHTRGAAIKIASLNIKGFGPDVGISAKGHKWHHVNQIMREKSIAVLCVQEAHLTEERQGKINDLYGRRLVVYASADPSNETGRGGVAVVINKAKINTANVKHKVIVEGRALSVRITQHHGSAITILCVYAPNNPSENGQFWSSIQNYYANHPAEPNPSIIMGDCNVIEDAIDRLPAREDCTPAVEALDQLKQAMRLVDGWRETFPDTKAYTYRHDGTHIQSQIDRIYLTKRLQETAREWKMETVGIPQLDHRMVSTQIVDEIAPSTGPGRCSINTKILKDAIFKRVAREEGILAIQKIARINERGRSDSQNAQLVWKQYKKALVETAFAQERASIPKVVKHIRKLEDDVERIQVDGSRTERERMEESARLNNRIREVETRRHANARDNLATLNWVEGETVTRSWIQQNKEVRPRDMIYALRKTNNPETTERNDEYERNSQAMANMARDYHEGLQNDDTTYDVDKREEAINNTLNRISVAPCDRLTEDLEKELTRHDVLEALKHCKNHSAAGLDGTIYELWKTLNDRHTEDVKAERKEKLDIVDLLREVFNDIERHGTAEGTDFAEAWMCPLYKKGDRNEIKNYRPISLLNTDYKILTKALSLKLGRAALTLIHPSQAGCMKGRHITDQTMLTRMVMEHGEVYKQDGLVIALDQEKAYGRIAHDYLWRALESFGLPGNFINTVKALYKSAETKVIINGEVSNPFRITRGVRQGDPLSCLLFNLAIEPLAESLRQSELKGIQIPDSTERLIASLFADDTTVYLAAEDNLETLNTLLDEWCLASKAKFNSGKTEIIPIGSREYRDKVTRTRCTHTNSQPLQETVHIATEGEAVRILGAWFGNGIEESAIWTPKLDVIDKKLEIWERGHPSLEGRKHIISMYVGGMTQYLTHVQTMPRHIEDRLEKRIRKFMWEGRSIPPVNLETLYAPPSVGGRGLLDIKARNKAIKVMRAKAYFDFGPNRPLWANFADALLRKRTPASENDLDKSVKMNPFLQQWKTSSGHGTKMGKELRELLTTARDQGIRPEGIAISRDILRQMPIWLHREDPKRMGKRELNSDAARCLRDNHKLLTVGDAERMAKIPIPANHMEYDECECTTCMVIETATNDCRNPARCHRTAIYLLNHLPPKWDPRGEKPEDNKTEPEHSSGTGNPRSLEEVSDVFDR